jgi:hypothetical protein
MPVIVDWYDKTHNIILIRFIGNWTLAEYLEGDDVLQQLCQQAAGRFDIITDFSESVYVPPVGSLWTWKQAATTRDSLFPNWGLTVFVNAGGVLSAYFEEGILSSEVIRKHCRLAKNVIEAVQIIRADRANTQQDNPSSSSST